MNCDICWACCMEMCSPPFLGDPPAEVAESYEAGMMALEKDGWPDSQPCFWLDPATKRCIHYEHRPEICRDFPVGGDACRSLRRLYTPAQAVDRAKETDDG